MADQFLILISSSASSINKSFYHTIQLKGNIILLTHYSHKYHFILKSHFALMCVCKQLKNCYSEITQQKHTYNELQKGETFTPLA